MSRTNYPFCPGPGPCEWRCAPPPVCLITSGAAFNDTTDWQILSGSYNGSSSPNFTARTVNSSYARYTLFDNKITPNLTSMDLKLQVGTLGLHMYGSAASEVLTLDLIDDTIVLKSGKIEYPGSDLNVWIQFTGFNEIEVFVSHATVSTRLVIPATNGTDEQALITDVVGGNTFSDLDLAYTHNSRIDSHCPYRASCVSSEARTGIDNYWEIISGGLSGDQTALLPNSEIRNPNPYPTTDWRYVNIRNASLSILPGDGLTSGSVWYGNIEVRYLPYNVGDDKLEIWVAGNLQVTAITANAAWSGWPDLCLQGNYIYAKAGTLEAAVTLVTIVPDGRWRLSCSGPQGAQIGAPVAEETDSTLNWGMQQAKADGIQPCVDCPLLYPMYGLGTAYASGSGTLTKSEIPRFMTLVGTSDSSGVLTFTTTQIKYMQLVGTSTSSGFADVSIPCPHCNVTPDTITVRFPTVTNGTCANCANLAGDYVLSWRPDLASLPTTCTWAYEGSFLCDTGDTQNFRIRLDLDGGDVLNIEWNLRWQWTDQVAGTETYWSISPGASPTSCTETVTLFEITDNQGLCSFPTTIDINP